MTSLTKAFTIALLVMLTVTLIICFMDMADTLKFYDLIALGFASTISVIGCIAATVAISLTNTES